MRKLFMLVALLGYTLFAQAQKASISGQLLDSVKGKNPIAYATVSLFEENDSTLLTFKLSDSKGTFKFSNLKTAKQYRLVVNAWQYQTFRENITITAEASQIDLGNIYLSSAINQLQEVVIKAERPPIIVRKDTIEFNAESFKTLPSAVAEDLLRKLPGVSMNANGEIKVNGKSVSKILVDGKEFFGGDQKIATKNLPANIIDKVQVSDDQEAKRRDPDILAANTPQIINLKLKKAIKKGAFGKVYAGTGLNELYESGGIINLFRDTTQISLLAYSNNVNKTGFSVNDIMRIGGMDRSGINMMMVNDDGGFALNGISFGGAMQGGKQNSIGAGMNFNTLTKKGTQLNLSYFLGHGINHKEQYTDSRQAYGTDLLFGNSNTTSYTNSYSHNINAKLESKPDSLSTFTLRPVLSLGIDRSNMLRQEQNSNASNVLNNSHNQSRQKGQNLNYQIESNYWKDFKKKGRNLNLGLSLYQKHNENDLFTNNQSLFYLPPSTRLLDQWRNQNLKSFGINLNTNYKEPISKQIALRVAVNANYLDNENALVTFNKNPLNQAYDLPVSNLSETATQTGLKTNNQLGLEWKALKNLTFRPAVVFNTINLNNKYKNNPNLRQNYSFVAPKLNIQYKELNIDYSPSFNEPEVQYLQPVADNSNPMAVFVGNPNLRPSRSHRVYLNYYKYNTKNNLSVNSNIGGSIQNDGIVISRTIAADGSQSSNPINANGIWEFYAGAWLEKSIKKSDKIQININTGFWSNYNKGITLVNTQRSRSENFNIGPDIGFNLNLNDVLELRQSFALNINRSSYNDAYFTDIKYQTYENNSEIIIRWPKKVVWETNFRFINNNQNLAYNNDIKLWNAAVTLLFMKNDRLQLKCSINDILNTGYRRDLSIIENTFVDSRTSNLGKHGLFTLTYNIQNFGEKVGGRQSFFGF